MINYILKFATAGNVRLRVIRVFGALVFILMSAFLSGCEKFENLKKHNSGSAEPAQSNFYVHMTDAPGDFSEVNIDLVSVIVKTSNRGEVKLNVNPGIYNLLDFRNGIDTLIATGGLDSCIVSQIRLVLGSRNSVTVDSVNYPLTVPSGEQSGLKIQLHKQLQAGVAYHLLLDFDANKSVIKTGNNVYKLKPVIRAIDTAVSGSIKGLILPAGVSATVSTTFNGVTYSATTDIFGNFLLQGLEPGTYDLTVTPVAPYAAISITGVVVSKGNCTNIGTHNL